MEQRWYEKLLWWLCEKTGHPLTARKWIYWGRYHRECKVCKRIISEPVTSGGEK